MNYFHGTTDFYVNRETSVTLGKFDGIHLGHRKLIRRVLEQKENGLTGVVFTLNVKKDPQILTKEEKIYKLEELGIDLLIDCPFVPEISEMSPQSFVEEILVNRLHVRHIAVGIDFRFGHNREGDAAYLKSLEQVHGFRVDILQKERYQGRDISSTYVREALDQGNMELAGSLLGTPYLLSGEVLHGRRIGRTLGMPTVNLIPSAGKYLPPNGVYASGTIIDDVLYHGITNLGYKPTVEEKFRGAETYLFDVDMDLYGKQIVTLLYKFERPEQKFASLDELKEQMQKDISFGKEYFGE